jgi:hypothetical protein
LRAELSTGVDDHAPGMSRYSIGTTGMCGSGGLICWAEEVRLSGFPRGDGERDVDDRPQVCDLGQGDSGEAGLSCWAGEARLSGFPRGDGECDVDERQVCDPGEAGLGEAGSEEARD